MPRWLSTAAVSIARPRAGQALVERAGQRPIGFGVAALGAHRTRPRESLRESTAELLCIAPAAGAETLLGLPIVPAGLREVVAQLANPGELEAGAPDIRMKWSLGRVGRD